MEPDAIIEVRFKETGEGGRQSPVNGEYYGCPLIVGGHAFDCRLLLAGRRLELGRTYEVQVKFLNAELALPRISKDTPFSLWEGREVATGKVIQVFRKL